MADEDLLLGLAEKQKEESAVSEVASAPAAFVEQVPAKPDSDSVLLDTLAREQSQNQDAAFRLALNGSRGVSPDKVAKDYAAAKQTGLPMEVVERQSDLVHQNLEDQQILANLSKTPYTKAFLSDADNFKLAKDDTAYLGGLEFIFAAVPPALGEGVEQVKSSRLNFKSMWSELSAEEQVQLRAFREAEQARGGDIKNFGADGWFENAVVELSRQLPILWNSIQAGGIGAGVGAVAGAGTALVLGNLGPQAAVPEEAATVPLFAQTGARIGGGANAMRAIFELETGQAYGEFSQFTDENGQLIDQNVAKVGALIYGATATGLEAFSLKKVLETVPGGKKILGQFTKEGIKDAMRSPVMRAAITKFLADYGKAVTAETMTEVMQEGAQVLIGEMSKSLAPGDFEGISSEEATSRIGSTFIATLQAMSLLGAVGPGLTFTHDSIKSMKAKNSQALLDTLVKHAQESKLAQRTPDKYLEFVKTAKEAGGLKDLYVDAAQFDQYFQSQGIDPAEFAKTLNIEDDLKQAAEAGNALRIPIEEYMTKVANTVHHEALKRSVKFAPNDMTLDEAEAFEKTRAVELQKVIQDSQREINELATEEALPKQLENIREKMVLEKEKGGAGFRAEDADAQVRLLLAGAKVLSKESGETVQDWFDRVNPVLNISAAPVSQGGDVLNQGVPDSLIEKAKNFPDAKSFIDSKPFLDGRVRRALYREFLQGKGVQRVSSDIERGDGTHSPAGPESGAPLYDLTENGVYPEDIYGPNGFRYYATGEDAMDRQAYSIISSVEGNPKASLKVYRAVEQDGKAIQPGDWVTTVRQYAKEHGEANISGGYKIVSKTVAARDLYASGDSWLEFGYHPQEHVSGFKPLTAVWEKAQQIKSAIGNQGTFDPKNPNILLQEDRVDTPLDDHNTRRTIKLLNESGVPVKSGDDIITLYHGTNAKGVKGITKDGAINAFSYLATDKAAAQGFAFGRGGGVIEVKVPVSQAGFVLTAMAGAKGATIQNPLRLIKEADGIYRVEPKYRPADVSLQDGTNQFFQTIPEGDSLVTLHNLSEANLKHADKIGGLAVPSLSIGKESSPLSGFGDISLVAPPNMVDPRTSKTNKVFNADIYSPRYPQVKYRSDTPALRKVNERFAKEAKDLGLYSFAGDLDAYNFDYKGVEALRESTVAQLHYLRSIGKDVEIPKRKAQTPTLDLNPKLAEFLDGHPTVAELAANPSFMKEFEKARLVEAERFVKNAVEEGRTVEEAQADYKELMGGVWYAENGTPNYRLTNDLIDEFTNRKQDGKPNIYEARTEIGAAVNQADVRPGFNKFTEQLFQEILKDERIVSDLTDREGNRRFLPHTLDNVVREMKRHLNDGEGFNYGVGSIRSVVAKQFKSISDLKKDRDKIVTTEKMEALKEEVNNDFFTLADKFEPYIENKVQGFGWADRFSEHLKEMTTRGTKAVMDDYYGGYIPVELLEEAKDFLNKLRNMDTEYFEAKVQRAVSLNEFAAAIVPDNVAPETVELLKRNGITEVIKYDRKNTDPGRVEALKALKKKRPDLFFQREKNAPKGSIEFANSATVISLFKAADRSTFLHEAGHLFMREMGKLVASGKASAQLQADYKTLTDFVGGDINSVQAQEKLARAFEAYLREGKAPSIKLTDAFRRFRDWLTKIYKEIRNLNVELNDEVRGVFDRILASEAELAEAERFYRSKNSLIEFVNPTEDQRADLSKKRKAAQGTAMDKQVAKHLRAYFDAIGGEKELRKQAEAEINARPVYKMIDAIIEAGGVDLVEIKKIYGKDVAAAVRKQHPDVLKTRDENAKGLGDFAAEFNFSSPDAAMEAIKTAVKKKEAITARTKDLIAEKESDIRKDLTAQEHMGGEEAIHNDATLTYLLAEANIILSKLDKARQRRPDQLEAKLYKDTAKEFLQKKKVREATRYDVYAKAEQKFAKAAFQAAEAGDLNSAYNFKVKQALNHALVQEAIRLRDEKADIENYFKVKNFKSKLKNVENGFMEAAVDLANTFGFLPTDAITVKTKNALGRLDELDEVLAAQTPDFILRKELPAGFKTYRDLTYQQFRDVFETVKAIINFGNDTLKSAQAGEEQSRQAVIDASVAKMQTLKDRVDSKLNELRDESSKASKVVGVVDGFVADATMVQFLSDWMDGFQFMQNGTFGPLRSLYNKVLDAEKNYNDTRKQIMDDSQGAWRTLGEAIQRIHKEHGDKLTIKEVPIPEDLKRTKRAYWSGQRMVALLLNTGNEGNYNAIQRGYSFTPQQIQKIASYFTADELKALQKIWDITDSVYPQLDETHFAIYNRHIEKVPGSKISFTSKDGQQVTLDGGYYPLIFDHNINDQAAKFFEEDMMKNQTQAVVRSTKPEDGFSFSRVPGHSLPPMLDTSVWFRHINNVTRYVTHARILRDINVITRDADWAREVKKRAGHEHYKALRSWLQFQANPARTESNDIFDWSRGVMTAVALGFKTSVGLKQRGDVLKGIRAIGGKDLGKGWRYVAKAYTQVSWRASVLGTEHNKSWQDIIRRSSYVRIRENNIDREISDLRERLNPHAVKRVMIAGKEFTARDIQDAAYFWIKMNDRAAVSVVWTAAYNKFIAENANPAESPAQQDKAAIAYADGIIQDTQASSLKPELSAIQRGEFKGLSRDMIKLFTAFMTESLKYGNRSMQVYRAWSNGSITTKELLHHIILEQAITPWTALMLGVAGKFGDLPEWWEFLLEPVYTYLSWIPIVRDVGGWWQHGIDKLGDTTFTGALKPIVQGLSGAGLFVIGEREFTDMLWDVGGLLQAVYKVPALNFVKDVQKAVESIEGA